LAASATSKAKRGAINWTAAVPVNRRKHQPRLHEKISVYSSEEVSHSKPTAIGPLRSRKPRRKAQRGHRSNHRLVHRHIQKEGLLLKYDTPERKQIPDELKDRDGFYTSLYMAVHSAGLQSQNGGEE
jgi:hypothetical protein